MNKKMYGIRYKKNTCALGNVAIGNNRGLNIVHGRMNPVGYGDQEVDLLCSVPGLLF